MIDSIKKLIAPFGFIAVAGTGFVFLPLGLNNCSLILFMVIRFSIATLLLFLFISFYKIPFPKTLKEVFHISVTGILSLGIFSTACMYSIKYGASPAFLSLVVSLQPIVVAFFAMKFLNEDVTKNMWFGLLLGLFGLVLVLGLDKNFSVNHLIGFLFAFLALLGMSFASLYQKRFCSNMNLFSGGVIQNFFSTLVLLPFLYFEKTFININWELIVSLGYMAIFASIFAMGLLFFMIRKGEVSKVSSIFYLLPVVSAIVSYFLLDKSLELNVLVGIGIVILSMTLINRKFDYIKNLLSFKFNRG